MARKEAIFTAKVDTGSSVNDVKKLEKEMVNLNDQMEELSNNGEQNTTAFKDLSKAFDKTQNDLKKFSGDMEHLGGDILVEVTGSISKMEDRMYELALAGDTTSKEFRELQTQTAKYKKIIIETDRSIDALAEQGRGLSSALSISSTAVAGFQAYTGVTALLGVENEELLETITKLQAAQGVLNSIEVIKQQLDANSIVLTRAKTAVQKLYNLAIGNGTKAMKLLRGAMIATGIGALIVGVGLLIANFDKLKNMLSRTTKEQETMNAVNEKAIQSSAKELSALDKLQKTLKDSSLSREEQVKAVKRLQTEYPNLLSNLDAETASQDEVNASILLNIELVDLQAKATANSEIRIENYKKQLQNTTDAQTGQNVGWWDSAKALASNVTYLDALTLGLAGTTDMKQLQKDAIESANESTREENALLQKNTDFLDENDKALQKKIQSLKEELGTDEESKKKKKAKTDADKKANTDAIARAKQRESARLKEQEQINQFLLEQSELEDELFKMRLSANELEEQSVSDKYDTLMLKAHGNAELEKQLIIQQEAELGTLRKGFADKTALDQATAIETANTLRHSLMRDSLTEDLAILNEKYQAEREALQENELISSEEKIILMGEILEREKAEEDLIRVKWNAKEVADEKKKTDEKSKIRDAFLKVSMDSLKAMSDLNALVTDLQLKKAKGNSVQEEKIRKKSFNRNKALQVNMAIITGIQSVMSGYAAGLSVGGPMGLVMGPVMAGVAGVTAAINVAKIAAAKYEGGGGGGGASMPSANAGAGASASSFAISDDTSSAQTELNADGSPVDDGSGLNKVVVVETDITTAVNNVAKIDELSTF